MPIDPIISERLPLLNGLRSFPEAMADPAQAGQLDAFMSRNPEYVPPDVATSDREFAGRHGPIHVRVYTPPGERGGRHPGLVWLHGGAFMSGDLDMPESDAVARELAHRADAVVVTVDYRLAVDGVHYPVPLDDVVDAWRATVSSARALGIDETRLFLGGGSAGGTLASGAALRTRDEGDEVLPAALLLAYPCLHAIFPPVSEELTIKMTEVPRLLRFLPEDVEWITKNYLGGPLEDAPGYAMPANADLTGLPPIVMVVSEYDDLRTSGEAFAGLAADAGVSVQLITAEGALHGHLNHTPDLMATELTLQAFTTAITAHSEA
jgi:acetyl esterase/lipase